MLSLVFLLQLPLGHWWVGKHWPFQRLPALSPSSCSAATIPLSSQKVISGPNTQEARRGIVLYLSEDVHVPREIFLFFRQRSGQGDPSNLTRYSCKGSWERGRNLCYLTTCFLPLTSFETFHEVIPLPLTAAVHIPVLWEQSQDVWRH